MIPSATHDSKRSSKRSSTLAILVVPAAMASAGALLALRLHFQPPTVPEYTLASSGEVVSLSPGGRFEVDIHPTVPVVGAVGARAFLLRGTEVRPWDPTFEVARDGSVHLAGPVDALFAGVPAGEWEVAIVVGRPETLPTAPNDVLHRREADRNARPEAWRLVRERIRLGR